MARLVVTVGWQTSFSKPSDFDLHLIGPDGSDCYYANSNPDWGVLGDPKDDPLLLADVGGEPRGGGKIFETIQILDPAPGVYQVSVHLFDDFADPRPIFPDVTVDLDGVTASFFSRGNIDGMTQDDVWDVTSFTVEADNALADSGDSAVAKTLRSGNRQIARALLPPKLR